jgi:hypothetical protein
VKIARPTFIVAELPAEIAACFPDTDIFFASPEPEPFATFSIEA